MNNQILIEEEKRLNTQEFIDGLTKSFSTYIKKGIIKDHPSIFVQGQPGIGKSQAIKEIAKNLEKSFSKKVKITDIRLLLFNPVDLRGIPVADIKKKVAIWLKPEIFELSESEDIINILFLDELTAAPSSLQAAAYQIALDRHLGEHKIPNNTFILAAGNRRVDNAIAYDMPSALKNRFIHFELKSDFEAWLSWANKKKINQEIIDFLKQNPDKFISKNLDIESNIIITPRSWEILSDLLKNLGGSVKKNEIFVSSVIGNSLTYLMINQDNIININDLLNGREFDKPVSMSELQRIVDILISQMEEYIQNQEYIRNILTYMTIIPMDYATRIFKKIIKSQSDKYELASLEEYKIFMKKLEEYNEDEQ